MAALLDVVAQLAGAILFAFLAIAIVKSERRGLASWALRLLVGVPLIGVSLWMVVTSIPYPAVVSASTLAVVASAVIIAGLGAEELIGADVRRILGI